MCWSISWFSTFYNYSYFIAFTFLLTFEVESVAEAVLAFIFSLYIINNNCHSIKSYNINNN